MKRFVEGLDRGQSTLFPECLEGWVVEENPIDPPPLKWSTLMLWNGGP